LAFGVVADEDLAGGGVGARVLPNEVDAVGGVEAAV